MSVRRGLVLSSIERYGVLAMGLATTFVTARLLTPADFGVAIVGLAIFGIIDIFKEFGGVTYIVQVDDATPRRVQTVFTFTLLLALPLFLILFLLSGPIASFYGVPGLKQYLHVSAWCLLLSSFSSPVYGLLSRNMQFGKLTVLSLTTTILNSLLTITLVLKGFSYMSFAWAQLISSVVYFGFCVAWGPKFPIYRIELTEWRRVFGYGIFDSSRGILNHLGDSLPFLAFGKTLGIEALGIYQRALTVSRLPERTALAGLFPVLQPAFSKHAREGQNLGQSFLMSVEYVTAILWPALVCIALLAKPLVAILLGSQWTQTVPLVQIIAISLIVLFPINLARPVLVAVGAVRDTALIAVLTVPIVVTIQIAASIYGLEAVAWSSFLTNAYAAAVSIYFVRWRTKFTWPGFFRSMRKSAIVTAISSLPAIAAVMIVGSPDLLTIPEGLVAAVLAAGVWLIAIHWTGHPMKTEIARIISHLTRRTRGSEI